MSARRPTVEWQVCGVCNYDCSYCIQSPHRRIGAPSAEDVERFLAFFRALGAASPGAPGAMPEPRAWEVKMTGGEPFASDAFLTRIVPGLIAETPHVVSVLTNLSASEAELARFATLTRGRLGIVSASLHLEHVEPSRFVDKARALRAQMDPSASLVVNTVLVPGRLAQVLAARALVQAAGLRLFPQVMKIGKGVARYADDEREPLAQLLGRAPTPRDANTAPSWQGRTCWTGVDYFVLTQRGDAWRCRTAKRFDEGFLGNVLAGTFAPAPAPTPCPYSICPCTVPANRGMIDMIDLSNEKEALA